MSAYCNAVAWLAAKAGPQTEWSAEFAQQYFREFRLEDTVFHCRSIVSHTRHVVARRQAKLAEEVARCGCCRRSAGSESSNNGSTSRSAKREEADFCPPR